MKGQLTMMRNPVSVEPRLPHPALPAANWADCYEIQVDAPDLSAMDAARMAAGQFPLWVRLLMRIRNAVTGLVGLKPAITHSTGDIEMIGIFPVVSKNDREVVLGFDDRHLDFRVVIDVQNSGARHQIVSATTLVNRKILLGRIYITVITPFHKLVVVAMLKGLGRQLSPT
jgi:hypothetical protein